MSVSIPTEIGDITAAWLEAALATVVPGVKLQGVNIVKAHSGTTGRARVVLAHNDPRLPDSMFIKLAPFDITQRGFVDQTGMGVAEARFYAEIAADVPVRHPHSWYAAHDDEGRYIMVLEDLTAAGAKYPGQNYPEMPVFVARVIEALAALHVAFWNSPRFAADGELAWVAARSRGYGSAADLVRYAVDQLGDHLPGASRRLAEVYCPRADDIAELLARGDRTLVHGDAHLGNMFVDGDAAGFLDWALVGSAPGMRDVAYFLGASAPTGLRRASEGELISTYCERLRTAGVILDADDAKQQYRLQLLTAWIAAVVTAGMGSKWQTIEIGMAAIERADAAISDHHVAHLLVDLLP